MLTGSHTFTLSTGPVPTTVNVYFDLDVEQDGRTAFISNIFPRQADLIVGGVNMTDDLHFSELPQVAQDMILFECRDRDFPFFDLSEEDGREYLAGIREQRDFEHEHRAGAI
jgi:hypothetical protein